MIYKLTQLLLIITIGLNPLLNVMANSVQPYQAGLPMSASPASADGLTVAGKTTGTACCMHIPGTACNTESDCSNHCFSTLIILPHEVSLDLQPPFAGMIQTVSGGVKSRPLTRPPKI